MEKLNPLLLNGIFLIFLILLPACAEEMLDPVDKVEILSVSPEKDIADGELVNFTMEIFYNLASQPTATLFIGYNTGEPNSLHIDTRYTIQVKNKRGYHQFQFGTMVHKWEKEPFLIYVCLAEDPIDYTKIRTFSIDKYSIIPKE